jgi:hypothetical protein
MTCAKPGQPLSSIMTSPAGREEMGARDAEDAGEAVRGEADDEESRCQVGEDAVEAQKPRVSRNPCAPSRKEIDERYATHLQFRDRCPCCVQGKMENPSHRKVRDHDRGVDEVRLDYCFMDGLKMLVTRDRNTRVTFSDLVRCKGRCLGRRGTSAWKHREVGAREGDPTHRSRTCSH